MKSILKKVVTTVYENTIEYIGLIIGILVGIIFDLVLTNGKGWLSWTVYLVVSNLVWFVFNRICYFYMKWLEEEPLELDVDFEDFVDKVNTPFLTAAATVYKNNTLKEINNKSKGVLMHEIIEVFLVIKEENKIAEKEKDIPEFPLNFPKE